MKPIGAHTFWPQSRRRFLLKGAAFGATGLASGFLGTVLGRRSAADETAMDMSSHATRAIGVPRAPFDKDALLIEPKVRSSVNGELRTSLRVGYAYKDIAHISPCNMPKALYIVGIWRETNEVHDPETVPKAVPHG